MRRSARRDENEKEIVAALRKVGCSVSFINSDDGVPDLVVGRSGLNYLLEVKDGSKPPGKQKLKPNQLEWHANWKGQKAIVRTIAEAFVAVGLERHAQIYCKQRGIENAL